MTLTPARRLSTMAVLLFCSGCCALIYQTVWMRQFRLLFGASTAATAATLAVFMGGLGLGGWLLGKRVEAHPRPLRLYGTLEIAIGVLAATTAGTLLAAKWCYLATGGSQTLGMFGATGVRLVLTALVIGPAGVLMGATLPAAARAVTGEHDESRSAVAVLLGVNTLGAVTGVLVSTFFLIEVLGAQDTLFCAAVLNVLLGLVSRRIADLPGSEAAAADAASAPEAPAAPAAPATFVIAAAAVVGFSFMVMELVWYRMLSPVLGGSTYTFGLILALALLGIGLGGGAFAVWGRGRPATALALAWTCGLEALAMALPFQLGDRIALLAAFLRPLTAFGFPALVGGWAVVASIVVLPAAVVAGYQFPLLIGLLGRGRAGVGREVGIAYAANTGGSILGSIAGGFGIIPLLSAPGAWRLAVGVLGAQSVWALAVSARGGLRRPGVGTASAAATVGVAIACLFAPGPTAAWRHSAIGVGRAGVRLRTSVNGVRDWVNERNRAIEWQVDGVESSVALYGLNGYAFIVNGKIDGHALGDTGTQVMGGLIGAALHPNPTSAFVIGLGTGSTAGWLAQVPSMERVDVAEIEPAILRIAEACAPVNGAVLKNPKVVMHLDDARELLMTSKRQYDVIFSEPSNPYRAGIASLYTEEFYASVRSRLSSDGVFLQWLQAYEIDSATMRSVLVTLATVFPQVEIWSTQATDLILVARTHAAPLDADALRRTLGEEPLKRALRIAWTTDTLEGFLAHFVAGPKVAAALREGFPLDRNDDDSNHVEFAFAKTVGLSEENPLAQLRALAGRLGADRPELARGAVDWARWSEEVMLFSPGGRPNAPAEVRHRVAVTLKGPQGAAAFKARPFDPQGMTEVLTVARALATARDEQALELANRLAATHPTEVFVIRGWLRLRQERLEEATAETVAALASARAQIWVNPLAGLVDLVTELAPKLRGRPELGRALFDALSPQLPLLAMERSRQFARLELAVHLEGGRLCAPAFEVFEPAVPWLGWFLAQRAECYARLGAPRAAQAAADLEDFAAFEPQPLVPSGGPAEAGGRSGASGSESAGAVDAGAGPAASDGDGPQDPR